MVVICDKPYPQEHEEKYREHFERFPYPLSDFQKYSVQAIVEGHHTLVSAATGNGKTVSADFAIQYFVQKGKKVIYTCPIKSLSNQKFYDFSQKYPDIQFGIFTGDVKFNPTADVIFATAEILMNHLFSVNTATAAETNTPKLLQFQMDIETDLACVVMDECHFMLDQDRGHVWENTILMLPPHVQMVLLSATLDQPVKFAEFCERGGEPYKQVVWSSTMKRIVPLNHYGFMTTIESIFKKVRDKETQSKVRGLTNTLIPLKSEGGAFQEAGYQNIKYTKQLLENNQVYLKRSHVLNTLARTLVEKEMLPALVFTFSRKSVECCAKEITANLLEFDSKVPYTIQREAEQILRRKLTNYQEYMQLPEYVELIQLLEKGIGIHHSGMIPILREIVEFMISKRYIKMLFATDSFSIGLNCEIKTVVFTSVQKFNGQMEQFLEPHAYTQMAGRAGRRNMDTVGHVVHCNNLFPLPSLMDYKTILCGKPQPMESKFYISYTMVLNLIKNGHASFDDFTGFVEKSMMYRDLQTSRDVLQETLEKLREELTRRESIARKTPEEVMDQVCDYKNRAGSMPQKQRKEMERRIQQWREEYPRMDADLAMFRDVQSKKADVARLEQEQQYLENSVRFQIEQILELLIQEGFVVKTDTPTKHVYEFTPMGHYASHFAEIHPLVFTETMFRCNFFEAFTPVQLVAYLSCFTDVRVCDDVVRHHPTVDDAVLKACVQSTKERMEYYQTEEHQRGLHTGLSTKMNYDFMEEMMVWTQCSTEEECKRFLHEVIVREKQVSTGDFIKAMLKISAVAKEWRSICEYEGHMGLMDKLQRVDDLILKYVCTTQSLYV